MTFPMEDVQPQEACSWEPPVNLLLLSLKIKQCSDPPLILYGKTLIKGEFIISTVLDKLLTGLGEYEDV